LYGGVTSPQPAPGQGPKSPFARIISGFIRKLPGAFLGRMALFM
jgi:hypothetical protein